MRWRHSIWQEVMLSNPLILRMSNHWPTETLLSEKRRKAYPKLLNIFEPDCIFWRLTWANLQESAQICEVNLWSASNMFNNIWYLFWGFSDIRLYVLLFTILQALPKSFRIAIDILRSVWSHHWYLHTSGKTCYFLGFQNPIFFVCWVHVTIFGTNIIQR